MLDLNNRTSLKRRGFLMSKNAVQKGEIMNQLTTITTKSVERLTNTRLVTKRDELKAIMKDAETLLDAVNSELMSRVQEEGTIGQLRVGDRFVSIVSRPVFKEVSLKTAARFKAIKEVVDTAKLLPLVKAGKAIKGVSMSEYLTVR